MHRAHIGLSMMLVLGGALAVHACKPDNDLAGEAPLADAVKLRVISYNVMDGFTRDDDSPDSERREAVTRWLATQRPDVVAFDELNFYTEDRLRREAASWGHEYAILLKEKGYPTGLTSKTPITDVQRVTGKGFHHGFVRARTAGIVFYVVHLAPFDRSVRLKEAAAILDGIPAEDDKSAIMGAKEFMKNGQPVLVIGDFNALSPDDQEYYRNVRLFENMVERGSKPKPRNLAEDGGFDYSVIGAFRAAALVDVVRRQHKDPAEIFSFPTPMVDRKLTPEQLSKVRRRIDYALASPGLAEECVRADVVNGKDMDKMSDHYPLLIDLRWSPPKGGEGEPLSPGDHKPLK